MGHSFDTSGVSVWLVSDKLVVTCLHAWQISFSSVRAVVEGRRKTANLPNLPKNLKKIASLTE